MNYITIFFKEIRLLVSSPFFIVLTIIGNGLILMCSFLFWFLEEGINPKVVRYLDAVWWSFATATTTGYGDIVPYTDLGKILSILLMLLGLAIFSMYTAMFAEIIISSKKNLHRNK